jgi:mannonate dehydratase
MGAERLASFGEHCAAYEGVTHEDRYRNYQQFLDAIIPTCEEFDVKMGADAGGPMA